MEYKIINTKAYITKSKQQGEDDRIITIITKDIGVVDVYCKSIRKITSKLKYSSIPYNKVNVSLISSSKFILKNISNLSNLDDIWKNEKRYKAFVKLLNFCQKNIHQKNEDVSGIFKIIEETENYISKCEINKIKYYLITSYFFILKNLGIADSKGKNYKEIYDYISKDEKNYNTLKNKILEILAND